MSQRLTPEQVEYHRFIFEQRIKAWESYEFNQYPDGAGYIDKELNLLWEGYLQALHANIDTVHHSQQPSSTGTNDASEALRRMRQYSPVFTKAHDNKEPVFVLRAQDATAYKVIAQWINLNLPALGASHPKIISAKATLRLFYVYESKRNPD